MREIDKIAEEVKKDENLINDLTEKYESFILKCASSVACSYVSKEDNEWFIALAAFIEAVNNYSLEKGGFLNFAELIMRKRVDEFIKSQSRYASENSQYADVLDVEISNEDEDNGDCVVVQSEGFDENEGFTNNFLKLEIELLNNVLSSYGFTYIDLAECSPKSTRDKRACARALAYMLKTPILVSNMKVKKILPIKTIKRNIKINRKMLEHYRKYVIAAVEIFSGYYPYISEFYPYLSEYIKFTRLEYEN